jgi:hypothetical protein
MSRGKRNNDRKVLSPFVVHCADRQKVGKWRQGFPEKDSQIFLFPRETFKKEFFKGWCHEKMGQHFF